MNGKKGPHQPTSPNPSDTKTQSDQIRVKTHIRSYTHEACRAKTASHSHSLCKQQEDRV